MINALGLQGDVLRRFSIPHFERFYFYQLMKRKGVVINNEAECAFFKRVPISKKASTYAVLILVALAVVAVSGFSPEIKIYRPVGLLYSIDFMYPAFGTLVGLYSIKPRLFGEIGVPDCYRDELPQCDLVGREGILDLSYWEIFFLANASLLLTILVFSEAVTAVFPFLFAGFLLGALLFLREIRRGYRCRICSMAQCFMGIGALYFFLRFEPLTAISTYSQTLFYLLLFMGIFAALMQLTKVVVVVAATPEYLAGNLSISNVLGSTQKVEKGRLDTDILNFDPIEDGLDPNLIVIISLAEKKSLLCLKFLCGVQGRYLLSRHRVAIRLLHDRRLITSADDLDLWDAARHWRFDPQTIYERYVAVSQSVNSTRRLSKLGSTNLVDDGESDLWARRHGLTNPPYLICDGAPLSTHGDQIDNAFLTTVTLVLQNE